MKNILVLCLIGITLIFSYPSITLAVTEQEIVSQLEQREQTIKSIYGKFKLSARYLIDGNMEAFEKKYEWAMDGNVQKLTEEYKIIPERFIQSEPYKGCPNCPNTMKSHMMSGKEIRMFDGQVTKKFLPDSNSASIYSGRRMFSLGKIPVDWLLKRIQEKSLTEYLKQDGISLKFVRDVNLDGRVCHLLEFTRTNANGKLYLTYEQGGLVPVKLELKIKNSDLAFDNREEDIFSEFKHYGNISLPMKIVMNVYRVYPDKEQLAMNEVFTVEQLEVNTRIPESNLLLKFPAGTRVHDSMAGKDYIVH